MEHGTRANVFLMTVESITVECALCGAGFEVENDPELDRIFGRQITAKICDPCAAETAEHKKVAPAPRLLSLAERRQRRWIAEVGTRYAEFHREQLPAVIQPHIDRVLAWQPHRAGLAQGCG